MADDSTPGPPTAAQIAQRVYDELAYLRMELRNPYPGPTADGFRKLGEALEKSMHFTGELAKLVARLARENETLQARHAALEQRVTDAETMR